MQKKLETTQIKAKHAGGRSSEYTEEIGNRICELISTTPVGLGELCGRIKDLPAPSTIRLWRLYNAEFSAQYARAKLIQADILAEDCLDIASCSTPETYTVDRLQIDTRKWLASKLLPKQYGDKVLLEQKTEENDALKEELRVLRAKLDEKNKRDF
jgi:hypothetical protein